MNYGHDGVSLYGRRAARQIQSDETVSRRHKPDFLLVILTAILLVIGAVVVYAIGPGITSGTNLSENYYSSKQLFAIGLGLIGFVIASRMPIKQWKILQTGVIVAAVIVAFLVRFVGEEINGAHRWMQVGGFSFQAAELIKLALVLWLAYFLTKRQKEERMSDATTLYWLGAVVAAVVVVVAGLQSDLGSAAVMMAIIGVSSYIAGLPMKKLSIIVVVVAMLATIAVVSTPYRRQRVATFFNPSADCQAEGYQACQALITVGSGGVFGRGLGKSVQAYGYLPEPANDSIFAIVSEKFGFVGSSAVVVLFMLLLNRIIRIAKAASDEYMRLLVTSVAVWLGVQMMINVGAMVGLLPLKGITLPFVSYGGTSIIFVMIAMGIVFQVSRYTDLQVVAESQASNGGRKLGKANRQPSVYRGMR